MIGPTSIQPQAAASRPEARDVYAFDAAAALQHLRAADRTLASLMDAVGTFALPISQAPTVFGVLAEGLVYQQLSRKAAAAIFGRVCALFGPEVRWPTPHHILSVDESILRRAGMSRAKALAVTDLAVKVEKGLVPPIERLREMEDEEVVACLTQVRGIGRWTAEMFLIFRLGRPDVFPTADLGMRKGFQLTYQTNELPDLPLLAKYGERWQPYRTVATWYLWQALE